MTFVLDTNIIVYGLDPSDPSKQSLAERLLDAVLVNRRPVPRQVLGELLNIGHKRGGDRLANHRSIVTLIEQATLVVDTDRSSTLTASQTAEPHKLQYLDALN